MWLLLLLRCRIIVYLYTSTSNICSVTIHQLAMEGWTDNPSLRRPPKELQGSGYGHLKVYTDGEIQSLVAPKMPKMVEDDLISSKIYGFQVKLSWFSMALWAFHSSLVPLETGRISKMTECPRPWSPSCCDSNLVEPSWLRVAAVPYFWRLELQDFTPSWG